MQLLMTASRTEYDAAAIRRAIEALRSAVIDPHADSELVSLAHEIVASAQYTAPAVVVNWIADYLESLSHPASRTEVTDAVLRLAEHFKLPPPGRTLALWEQGRLFD